jgi:hypothetical protein
LDDFSFSRGRSQIIAIQGRDSAFELFTHALPERLNTALRDSFFGALTIRQKHPLPLVKHLLVEGAVYQCVRQADDARGVDEKLLQALEAVISRGRPPSLTIILDVPAELALERIPVATRHRVEKEGVAFHERVRDGFLSRAAAAPERIRVLDGTMSAADVLSEANVIIDVFMNQS